LNYGFSASLNIFDGFAQNRNVRKSPRFKWKIQANIDQQNWFVRSYDLYQIYLTNLELIVFRRK
jgi:hypothetical protein